MQRTLLASVLVLAVNAWAQADKGPDKKSAKDAELGKKESSVAPDKSLAGDVSRKKKDKSEAAPALQYDQFRLGVELQVGEKRRSQIDDLKKIISLSNDAKEMPKLLFRLGELYWEESRAFFFEANRKDDDLIRAMNADDKGAQERAKSEKAVLLDKSKDYARMATDTYARIVQEHKDFERNDEVLYFLGRNLMEASDERRALAAYKRLIDKYPKSKYLPDAYLAFGEYYFNGSKGKRDMLEKALENYKKAAGYPDNSAYAFALYKQGWCHYNLQDYPRAMDQFKSVVLYSEIAGVKEVEGEKGRPNARTGLVREARNDYVRAYARGGGSPTEARADFGKLAKKPEDQWVMLKQLANLFYEDGKDKEAALTYDMLIKDKPLSPEAPGFQGKIVDCVMRAGNKQMTVQQVRRLVKIMDDVTRGGAIKDDKDKKAIEEAKELSERTISNLAVNWHNEGKKTRDDDTFKFANEVYGDYLTLFSDNPKAYDLRFFWAELLNDSLQNYPRAADEYTRVLLQDAAKIDKNEKPGKWVTNAAYNAVLAQDIVVKGAAADTKPKTEGADKKVVFAEPKQKLLDACERYLKYVPNGEKRVEIAYKAARIFYEYKVYDQAVARFSELALKYPDYKFENGDRAGELSANLVLDVFAEQEDWAKANEWARRFYAEEKLAVGGFRVELAKLIEKSSFKLVNQLEAKKDYARAAEAYLVFVNEFPKSDIADQALHNAAIDFFNGKQLDRAIETRKRLIQSYPKSKFLPQTMYALAEGYEATADFENASDYYEAYAAAYEKSVGGAKKGKGGKAAPKKGKDAKGELSKSEQTWDESKAQVAIFNAGVFREGLGQYKQALKNRERYLELWPDAKDAEAVFLSIADLHEKHSQWAKAIKQLEEYEKLYSKDPSKVLTAEGRIASLYEEKLRSAPQAKKVYGRIRAFHDKLPTKTKKSLEITALDAVARAALLENDDDFKKYAQLKLRWTKLTNPGELKASIQQKSKGLEQVQKAYTTTVGYKSAGPAICALHKIGLAYDDFVQGLGNPPLPKGTPEELKAELQVQFAEQARPLHEKAAEAFAAAVQKSQELDVFNSCTTAALEKLRGGYRPEQFPKMDEEVAALKVDTSKQQALGGDMLTTVQSIPVVSSERLAEMKQKAKELGRNVAEADRMTIQEEKPTGATAPPKAKSPKQPAETEEPL